LERRGIGFGVVLLIGAVAGFVLLPAQKPGWASNAQCVYVVCRTGLPQWLYDVLRITTWAFLILGAALVVAGVIGRSRSSRRRPRA
jgi:hypothetical protein